MSGGGIPCSRPGPGQVEPGACLHIVQTCEDTAGLDIVTPESPLLQVGEPELQQLALLAGDGQPYHHPHNSRLDFLQSFLVTSCVCREQY